MVSLNGILVKNVIYSSMFVNKPDGKAEIHHFTTLSLRYLTGKADSRA
jgi:hypothetical protein